MRTRATWPSTTSKHNVSNTGEVLDPSEMLANNEKNEINRALGHFCAHTG